MTTEISLSTILDPSIYIDESTIIETDKYMSNPVVTLNYDHNLIVGRTIKIEDTRSSNGELLATIEILPDYEDTISFLESLESTSSGIGCIPLETKEQKGITLIKRCVLLEITILPKSALERFDDQ